MATENLESPLVVIVGPTASGKTALSLRLAEKFNGEIICADSRTIYREMDIGTAKPTRREQQQVPHWGIDLVSVDEKFTAADFKSYTEQKITEIRKRGKIPFLVGGTGLYIDSVIFDFQFGPEADEKKRNQLENMSLEELHEYCKKNNITFPENKYNKRYVIRSIEKGNQTTKQKKLIENTIVVGITTDKEQLRNRISERADKIFSSTIVQEATELSHAYGWDHEAMTGSIYRILRKHMAGEVSIHEAKELFIILDWRLAKRQMTWFKRNPYIHWKTREEAEHYIATKLAA